MFDPTLTERWLKALDHADDPELKGLAETEYPGTTLFHLAFFAMRLHHGKKRDAPVQLARIANVRAQLRSSYGWAERRRFDIEALREWRSEERRVGKECRSGWGAVS